MKYKDTLAIEAKNASAWRQWLSENSDRNDQNR